MTPQDLETDKYAVIRSLFGGRIPFHELMAAFDIRVSVAYLGPGCYGISYCCTKGHYHIVISDSLSIEAQQEVFFHELSHIIEDMPQTKYAIELNKQWHIREREADMLWHEVQAAVGK